MIALFSRDPENVWQLATAFGEIAIRRRGPEILPDSNFLLASLLVIYVVANFVDFLFYGIMTGRSLLHLAAQLTLLLAYVFAVLTFFKLERRYRQTLSAILGANIFIFCMFIPIALAALLLGLDLEARPFIALRIGMLFWAIFIEAFILARALSQPFILGAMFEILYVLPSWSISGYFAPSGN